MVVMTKDRIRSYGIRYNKVASDQMALYVIKHDQRRSGDIGWNHILSDMMSVDQITLYEILLDEIRKFEIGWDLMRSDVIRCDQVWLAEIGWDWIRSYDIGWYQIGLDLIVSHKVMIYHDLDHPKQIIINQTKMKIMSSNF